MKKARQWQRILILALLCFTVFAPLLFVSTRLKRLAFIGPNEFVEDLSVTYGKDSLQLKVIEQEAGEGLKEPKLVIYKEKDLGSVVSYSSSNVNNDSLHSGGSGYRRHDSNDNVGNTTNNLERKVSGTNNERRGEYQKLLLETESFKLDDKDESHQTIAKHNKNVHPPLRRITDEKVKEAKDQLIRAKAYLSIAPPGINSHLAKELRQRIKDLEKALGEANKDSDLSKSALHKMRSMEVSLLKASRVFPDCSSMVTKLRAMAYNAEEQLGAQMNQAAYLVQLAARTTPKGFHCLSMRLTTEFFALPPEGRQFPGQERLHNPDLYHYAVFSDNVLACAVIVNSTISSAREPDKIVFHVVTDSLNYPAISMWFLLDPPVKASIQIQSIDSFKWLFPNDSTMNKQNSRDPRFTSPLNHLRFHLPDIFPQLSNIVLFDHDVVVQRDLSRLWSTNMNGKVIGAVETCHKDVSYRRMDMFVNFSEPFVSKRFDVNACTWAFGMNLFDLQEWRKQNLTALYHKYLDMGYKRPLWKAGSLPLGWATFYNRTYSLDRRWHRLGLGYESGIPRSDIEQAAVIHYDGVMKPWLDIGIAKYRSYWSKHINYDHPYLQQCNIHA